MCLCDFHVHIDFYSNPQEIADNYESNKIYSLFVTNLPELYKKNIKSFNGYKYVKLALGYHPELVSEFNLKKDLFKELALTSKYIGEVGLDFKNEFSIVKNKQIDAFDFITQPKLNKNKIYSIHSRSAEGTALNILKKNNVKHAVFHWYSGNITDLNSIIDMGYYFSVNYKMLNTKKGKDIIKRIPAERLLFETDGPFIKYKNKLTTPKDIELIYKEFEEVVPNFKNIVFKNFKNILIERDKE